MNANNMSKIKNKSTETVCIQNILWGKMIKTMAKSANIKKSKLCQIKCDLLINPSLD